MAKSGAKFRFNTRELAAGIRSVLMAQPLKAQRAMNAVGGYLAGEAKDRAPIDGGFLTADITNKLIVNPKSYSTAIYIPSNATSSEYAVAMHEGIYNLGVDSQDKQRKVGKRVGRKFITRAIDENRGDIRKIIEHELKVR